MNILIGLVVAQLVIQPTLGSSVSAFTQALGGANDASIGPYQHFQRCAGTDVDQFVVMASSDQVWTIQREWCDFIMRSSDERFNDAAQFVPADAVAGEAFTDDVGESAVTFVSASLGSELPAGLFHDCSGNAVAAGTLFVVADSTGGWFMGPGTCPTE